MKRTIPAQELKKLLKKAKRQGVEIRISKPYYKEVKIIHTTKHDQGCFTQDHNQGCIEVVDVELFLDNSKDSEYVIVAYSENNVLSTFTQDHRIYDLDFKNCSHCNTKRNRKRFFVVKNLKTNELSVVGKECVKALCSILARNFANFHAVGTEIEKFYKMPLEEYETAYSEFFFKSRKLLNDAKITDLEDFLSCFQSKSDYCYNVRKMVENNMIPETKIKIFNSAIRIYKEKKAKEEISKKVDNLELSEGDKFTNIEVTVLNEKSVNTNFGVKYVYTFSNGMEWMTSKQADLNEGNKITLNGTVKGINNFNNNKTLKVIRCKFSK